MDELVSVLLSVQGRLEALLKQIETGALHVTDTGSGAATGGQSFLEVLREQRDDLDKAIALARNPQKKVY